MKTVTYKGRDESARRDTPEPTSISVREDDGERRKWVFPRSVPVNDVPDDIAERAAQIPGVEVEVSGRPPSKEELRARLNELNVPEEQQPPARANVDTLVAAVAAAEEAAQSQGGNSGGDGPSGTGS